MTAARGRTSDRDFSSLPPAVKIGDTLASIDTDRVPDSDDVRNIDQHSALRED
ncbi:hypothetical protein [Nocardioides seonyuensis]|uniref:hypothetical protein n=1 Tax=Nocardioides seonyuensis TaxID=2518371 RepID=UPI001420FFE3|nr:hypothetical protein [Nocardioides seonyuensis]